MILEFRLFLSCQQSNDRREVLFLVEVEKDFPVVGVLNSRRISLVCCGSTRRSG